MASNPFNALMDPMQFGMGLQNAFQMGMQNRQQAETQRALGAYAQNQSPETAAAVTRHNPMMGMQLQDREAQRQAQMAAQEQKALEMKLIGDALRGDPNARQQLAYVNADWYVKLADRDKLIGHGAHLGSGANYLNFRREVGDDLPGVRGELVVDGLFEVLGDILLDFAEHYLRGFLDIFGHLVTP